MSSSPEFTETSSTQTQITELSAALRPVATAIAGRSSSAPLQDEACRTPTSEESKLPSIPALECPPAPRKRRRTAVWRRWQRSRSWPDHEAEMIVVGTEEMEKLFQWREEAAPPPTPPAERHAKKRRFNDSENDK
ncbi:hypothetical protein Cni_G03586 [Canna indica]|uniref:Uncharacterized protein n=1 Tax=Canna indica TaxID=4628 RepID=A0AAQ3JRR0_9LILI|nr:hypothetical protein Cni_G03586 [Canna indica]